MKYHDFRGVFVRIVNAFVAYVTTLLQIEINDLRKAFLKQKILKKKIDGVLYIVYNR